MSKKREPVEGTKIVNDVMAPSGMVVQAGSVTGDVHIHHADSGSTFVPRELPSAVYGFTDRAEQLAEMDLVLTSADEPTTSAAVVISAISGTAGVGKTAFVTYWANRVKDRFPDGQLYVNLHGWGPQGPLAAAEALAGFLRSLGLSNDQIPHNIDERAARFRSLVAGRRMLIVLDNARDAGQIRPLLPGTSSCVVLVTSRDSLPGLVSRDGARRINLDLLPQTQAVSLLRMLIGPRVDAELAAAEALVSHCARLPLALRIVAELAVSTDVPLSELVRDLENEESRLDLLEAGDDPYTAVRAVLSWSYRNLDLAEARAFRLLGLHPGRDFDENSAAQLAGTSPVEARRLLGALVRAHLVERSQAGRYQMHDLLRVYAADLATQEESAESKRTALLRLFDYFLRVAASATQIAFPQEQRYLPDAPAVERHDPELLDDYQAAKWLEAERPTLLAVAVQAERSRPPAYAALMSAILARYLDSRSHFDDAVALHTVAVSASREAGDREGEARAIQNLGTIYQRLGRYNDAYDNLSNAVSVARQINDVATEVLALGELGQVAWLMGRYDEALDFFAPVLAFRQRTDDPTGLGRVLNNIGLVLIRLARHEEALGNLESALALFRETNDRLRQGYALNDIGVLLQRMARFSEAFGYHSEAMVIARAAGDRALEAAVLNGLGAAHRQTAESDIALELHAQALSIGIEVGDRYEQGQAHEGLGDARLALGDEDGARDHWRLAHTIYLESGAHEADSVAERLRSLGG
ncbi:ATP-binding protein [Saccharothrix sp. NRRL B-16348]|uniref:ATP-binding protein n=1 Tax=Saccharothrix sp. NRRL B-16348 TaxID=1415542 RepID=UPI0006AECC42|nr:tetratricopeptide repeat protein [Saccharothrix sp. NRRL B-16348]